MHLAPTTYAAATAIALEVMEEAAPVLASATFDVAAPASLSAPSTRKAVDLALVARLRALTDTGYKGKLWSRNELARAIGSNSANVSIYLRQDAETAPEIKFDVGIFEAKAKDFLTTLASRREFNGGIIATAVVTRFSAFVDNVRATTEIGFFYGDAGLGKTTAMESYAAGNPNALCLSATKWQCGAHGMEVQLAAALHIGVQPRGSRRAEAVAAKLMDFAGCILIDNAHRLTVGAVEFLFDLYDLTTTPLVFVGNRRFMDRLRSDDQLFSRLFYKTEAGFPDTPDKPRNHAIHAAADALLKREMPAHFAELKTMARKVAREPGHLRALVKRCRSAAEIARHPSFADRPITDAFLAAHASSVHTGYQLEGED